MNVEAVIVIGAGPAGIATGIQLQRHGITPIILEATKVGGLLINADRVENYPGFPSGIAGLDLVALFENQLKEQSIGILFEKVINLDLEGDIFCIETSKSLLYSRTVVVASGTKPKEYSDLAVPEAGGRILYEIHPIIKAEGKKIIIIGAGDAAFDYALNLGNKNEVIILNRGETVKCIPFLWERVKRIPGISYYKNTGISRIVHDSATGLRLECLSREGVSQLYADYMVFAIGREPQLDFLSDGIMEDAGVLEKKGVLHFIGDVKNDNFRQTAIAVGDGIMAAMKLNRKLGGEVH